MAMKTACLPVASALALFWGVGCSSSGAEPGPDGASPEITIDPTQVGTLQDECAAVCQKQDGRCPASPPVADCISGCVSVGQAVPTCSRDWATLQHCQAAVAMQCDAQGEPFAVGCGLYVTSYAICKQVMAGDGG
jgi:hypothetical protein